MDMKRTTIALNGTVFLLMLGIGLITPILPGKVYSLSQSTVQVGILAAAFACSYVLVQIPMGILADRYGYKPFIVLGYILCGIAGILYLIAGSTTTLFIGRIIQGVGEAPLWALAPALLSIINGKRKGKVIGRYNASIHLGLTIGSLIGFISLEFVTEKQICSAYLLLCFIAALWTTLQVHTTSPVYTEKEEEPLNDRQVQLRFLREPGILAVLMGISLYGIGYGVFMTIIPTYMASFEFSHHNVGGLVFIVFYVGITLAQFIGGPLADHKGRRLPMLAGLSLFSIGMLFFFRTSFVSSLLFLSISSFGLGLFLAGSIAFLNDQADTSSKGFISGLFYFFWGSGYFFGPLVLGYAGKCNSYSYGFNAMGVSGLTALFLIMLTCSPYIYSKPNHCK